MIKQLILLLCLMVLPSKALSQGCVECEADIDGDGSVALSDLTIMKSEYGTLTCCDKYPAPIPKTGQTISYATGDDGDLEKGVAWPNPRFTDNGDGTVTDNLTGLIWLKDANCFGTRTWANALSDCNGLADGSCGLSDGSIVGDWRLPHRKELFSLVHDEYYNPAVPNTAGTGQWSEGVPFTNVQSNDYLSSTTVAYYTDGAWGVDMYYGSVNSHNKTDYDYVWPVRGGQ